MNFGPLQEPMRAKLKIRKAIPFVRKDFRKANYALAWRPSGSLRPDFSWGKATAKDRVKTLSPGRSPGLTRDGKRVVVIPRPRPRACASSRVPRAAALQPKMSKLFQSFRSSVEHRNRRDRSRLHRNASKRLATSFEALDEREQLLLVHLEYF